MDLLDEFLNDEAINKERHPAIRAACALGKKVLNKYYSKTDESEMYRISMGTCFFIFCPCAIYKL